MWLTNINKVVNFKSYRRSCAECCLTQFCLPRGLDTEEFDLLARFVVRERFVRKGEEVFMAGQPLGSLFTVRFGSIKTMMVTHEGEQKIFGFHMPGDLLGLDAISRKIHKSTAVALEDARLCELPYRHVCELCEQSPAFARNFVALMSDEIVKKHETMAMLAKRSAEQKIAALLFNISSRLHDQGISALHFNLSMSRHDIASFLGLAVETVSRLLGNIDQEGIIKVNRKRITIRDMAHLQRLAQN